MGSPRAGEARSSCRISAQERGRAPAASRSRPHRCPGFNRPSAALRSYGVLLGVAPSSTHFIAVVLYQIIGSEAPSIRMTPAIRSGPTTPRKTCFHVGLEISTLKSWPTRVPLTVPGWPLYRAVPVISVPFWVRSTSTWAVGLSCSMFHFPLTSHRTHSARAGEDEIANSAPTNIARPDAALVLILMVPPLAPFVLRHFSSTYLPFRSPCGATSFFPAAALSFCGLWSNSDPQSG